MITDYASLQTAVAQWANRDDMTTYIPDFIAFGEVEMYKMLRSVHNERTLTSLGNPSYISVPDDYEEMITFSVDGLPLRRVSPERVLTGIDTGAYGGTPQVWARTGSTFQVAGSTDGATYDYSLRYWGKFASLSDDNPTNSLLLQWPQLFLYSALVQLGIFLDDPKSVSKWSGALDRVVNMLNGQWIDESISGSETVVEGEDNGT